MCWHMLVIPALQKRVKADPSGSVTSWPSILIEPQTSERPHLIKQEEHLQVSKTQGGSMISTSLYTHMYMNIHQHGQL